tara:strand:+ start:1435 stop:1905 length:471 start_codon:yes stop_codon:yes gene_type:complete
MKKINSKYSNIRTYKKRIVRVLEIEITIPIESADPIIFTSNNNQLIFLCIHQTAIRTSAGVQYWEREFLKAISKDSNLQIEELCEFERMCMFSFSYEIRKTSNCKKNVKDNYIFCQKELLKDTISSDRFYTDSRVLEYLEDNYDREKFLRTRTLLK